MRVVFFASTLGAGGAERVITTLANAWAEDAARSVAIVTLATANQDFYGLAPGIQRIGLDLMADSSGLIEALGSNFRRIRGLRAVFAALRPDVVISFCDQANVLAILATRGLAVRLIVSERTDPAHHQIGQLWDRLRRWTYGYADALVVQTDAVAQWARRELGDVRTAVIPNPVVPPPAGESSDSLDRLPFRQVIVGIGRLGYEKGFDRLVEAFAKLPGEFADWGLVICGEGEQRPALESQIELLGLRGRVLLPGRVADPYSILRRSDLFVLPSRYEGFPNALLEAMAAGLPVVSFACPSGPRAIVTHGADGLLVPEGDVDELAAAMAGLMIDAVYRRSLGVAARSVIDRFGLERILQRWDELIREVSR